MPVLRLSFPQDDGTLTPYTFQLGYPLVMLVYDTLEWRDPGGTARPWAAQSVATSPDGRQVTAKLVPGIRWQDGTSLTSNDVAFTFRYVADHPHPRFTPEVAPVSSIDTPDPLTVVFHLRAPSASFVDQTLADVPILPAHIWQGLAPGTVAPPGLPVGSGPYRLIEYHPGQGYRFVANTDYFHGRPAVGTLDVSIISDRSAMVRAFGAGTIDAIPEDLLPAETGAAGGLGSRLVTGPSYTGTVLMFNLRRPPFDQPAVRAAVAEALNLPALAASSGGGPPADHGYLHPDSTWASPDLLHHYDPGAARAHLAGIGPVTILTPTNESDKVHAAQQIAATLTATGMAATAKVVDPAELDAAVGEDGSSPTFEAAIWTIPSLASEDPSLLERLFAEAASPSLDYPGYQSATFTAQAQRIDTAADPAARASAVQLTLGTLANDVPVVPLYFSSGIEAIRPAVYDGWVFVKGTGILDKQSFLPGTTLGRSVTTTGPVTSTTGRTAGASNGTTVGGAHGGIVTLTHFVWVAAGGALVVLLVLAALTILDRRSPAGR